MIYSACEQVRDAEYFRTLTWLEFATIIGLRHTRMLMQTPVDKVLRNKLPVALL